MQQPKNFLRSFFCQWQHLYTFLYYLQHCKFNWTPAKLSTDKCMFCLGYVNHRAVCTSDSIIIIIIRWYCNLVNVFLDFHRIPCLFVFCIILNSDLLWSILTIRWKSKFAMRETWQHLFRKYLWHAWTNQDTNILTESS